MPSSPTNVSLPVPLARHVLNLSSHNSNRLPSYVKVTQWGAPLAAAKHVIFYFGGMPTSAEEPALHSITSKDDDAYAARNLHVICIDKPGMGGSQFSYGFQIRRDWPVLVNHVAEQLSVNRTYGVMGISNGGPYVMSALTHPTLASRVKAGCMIVGVSDSWASGYVNWRTPSTLFESFYNTLPLWVTGPINTIGLHTCNFVLFRLGGFESFLGFLPPSAKEPLRSVLQDAAGTLGLGASLDCQQALSPMYARQSSDERVDSVNRQASLAYHSIRVPVSLWYGTKDGSVPMASAEWLQEQIPQATLHKVEEGHELYFKRTDEVLDDFVRVLDAADNETTSTAM